MHSVPMFCLFAPESAAKSQVGLNSDTSEQISNYASSALRAWWKKCLYSSIMSKISLSSLLITFEKKYVPHINRPRLEPRLNRPTMLCQYLMLSTPALWHDRYLIEMLHVRRVCEIVFMLCYIQCRFSLTGFANYCIHICPSLPLCWR